MQWVGISEYALECFSPYFLGRTSSVTVHKYALSAEALSYGVRLGSFLGSKLFVLFPLGQIIHHFKGIQGFP